MKDLTAPVYWLYLPVTIAWSCFLIGVGDPGRFIDYPWLWFLFRHMSPHFWAAFGVVLAVGMSILGASWCVIWGPGEGGACGRALLWCPTACGVYAPSNRGIFITGSSLVGAAIRQPRITSKNLIRCEGLDRLFGGPRPRPGAAARDRRRPPPATLHRAPITPAPCAQRHLLRGRGNLRRHCGHHPAGGVR
jgi:hypothetical protein